jgi:cytochrome P450
MSALLVPPGPKARFLTGNLLDLRRDALGLFVRCARDFGDVATIRMGLRRVYVLNHPRLIEEVLFNNPRSFTKHFGARMLRSTLGTGLLTSEGDFWLRQRRLIQPAFSRERISAYAAVMVELADRLTAAWQDGETRDVHADMTRVTLQIIAQTMFGADVSDQAVTVGEAVEDVIEGQVRRFNSVLKLPPLIPSPANLRRRRSLRQIDSILYDIIDRRRQSQTIGNDLLGMLIRACDEGGGAAMTDRQLRDEAITLFLAGHDTTALTLTWGLYLLARHPAVTEALQAELDEVLAGRPPTAADIPRLRYTDMVIHEVMRLYPSAYVIGREAIAPCELGGYTIPAGGTLLMSQWAMQRDPRWFEEPERFRPERWADGLERRLPKGAYFPFGGGPRVCIGNHFAMLEAVLVLAAMARSWRFSVPPGEADLRPRPMITLRPARPVRLTLHSRQPKRV